MICLFVTFVFFDIVFSKDKLQIAVMDLTPQNISSVTSTIVSDFLRNELFNIEKFVVLERNNMEAVLKEQSFQRSGCTTNECAVEVGKLLNVQQMVVGSVNKLGDKYYINVRMVDVGSGTIIKSVSEKCFAEDELDAACKVIAKMLAGEIIARETKLTTSVISKSIETEVQYNKITEYFSGKIGISVYRSYWFTDFTEGKDSTGINIWGGSLKYNVNGRDFLGLDVLIHNIYLDIGGFEYAVDIPGDTVMWMSDKILAIPILLNWQWNITQDIRGLVPYIKFGLGTVIIKRTMVVNYYNGSRSAFDEDLEAKFGYEISGGTEIFVAPQDFPISISIDITYLDIYKFDSMINGLSGVKFDGGINVYF